MPFVIRILEPANRRRGGSNQIRKRSLGQASLRPEIVDFSRHRIIRPNLFQFSKARWPSLEEPFVDNLNRIGRCLFLSHFRLPLHGYVCSDSVRSAFYVLSLYLFIYFLRRHGPLFHKSVRKDRRDFPVEKVKDSIVDSLQSNAEFVNFIS
jgi:hypothetical protein